MVIGIKTKLIASFLALSMLPLLILSFLTYSNYEKVMYRNAEDYLQGATETVAADMASYFRDVSRILAVQHTYYVLQYIKLVSLHHRDLATRYAYRIFEELNFIRRTKSDLDNITIITPTGLAISAIGEYKLHLGTDSAYQALKGAGKGSVSFEGVRASRFGPSTFSIAEPIIDDDGRNVGVIEADISARLFAESLRRIKLGSQGFMVVADRKGRIVYDSKAALIGRPLADILPVGSLLSSPSGKLVFRRSGRTYLVSFQTDPASGWRFVSISPRDEIIADVARVRFVTVLTFAAGALLFIVLLSLYLSTVLTDPIKNLQRLMRRVSENDLSVRVAIDSRDEIGQLAASFNDMVCRIRELMNELVANHGKIRRLEAEALQEQIKPHFIYNTLDSILSLLEVQDPETAIDMVENLGTFLRTSLASGYDTVSVAEEISHVRSYLSIQRLRYGNSFAFEIDVDNEVLAMRTPRLLLQPIVENSLQHGLSQSPHTGRIAIRGYRCGGLFVLEVADDGVGIDERRLGELVQALANEGSDRQDRRFFGLRNTNARIKLGFGKEFGLQIASAKGKGTRVKVTLPT